MFPGYSGGANVGFDVGREGRGEGEDGENVGCELGGAPEGWVGLEWERRGEERSEME